MWAEANEDQCRWWLGTTTCTQIAVDAVTPFNCHPALVKEELLLAPHHPSFVPCLISCFLSRSHSCFPLCLFSLQFGQWVEFAAPSLCACYVWQLPNWCFLKLSFIFFLFASVFFFFNVCHGSLCLVLSCLLLSCLSFSLAVTLYHLSLSLRNIRHNGTLQTDLVWHGSGSLSPLSVLKNP